MKFIYTITLFVLSLLIFSCSEDKKTTPSDNASAIQVKVSEVASNSNYPFLAVSGKIQSVNSADLSTRMMGYVTQVPVSVGDSVKKGQLLVVINNADLQAKKAQIEASITEARAAFTNAEKDYNRFKNLFSESSATQKELDDMKARFEMTKARLEAAKQMRNEVNAQFAYSNITAPFAGVVTSKMIETGDMANPGMPLITVEAPGNFEVMAMVPETEISKIKANTEVAVLVKSINKTHSGKVSEISTSSKHTGGQYLVKITLDKTDADILSGMFVTVQFPVEKQTDNAMVLVPKEALVYNGQLTGVYSVSPTNTAILRWLRLGREYGNQVEVLSGLSADESYIVSAEGKLYNGAKVTIQ
ncbi:efflux RND transporter periplasmic adaptor subunit [Hanstruepera flava]|uniref:efflux RND transporter periplasmic adaptor subunit n=1 Tax=Hanstruepera flava TaxID=2930218 RepID=UPI0020282D4A|nr:efflux RND transporter periplasmic adaptor subunit [Hanstruepera flava]